MTSRTGSDAGNATLLAAVTAGLATWLMIAVVQIGVAAADRVALQTAADAAALAAVGAAVVGDNPRTAARLIAESNGGGLVSCRCPVFEGRSFKTAVAVERVVELPFLGNRTIVAVAEAQYEAPLVP